MGKLACHSQLGTSEKNPIDKLIRQCENTDEAIENFNESLAANFQEKVNYKAQRLPLTECHECVDEHMVNGFVEEIKRQDILF